MTFETLIACYQQFFLSIDSYSRANSPVLLSIAAAGTALLLLMRISIRHKKRLKKIKVEQHTQEYIVESPDVRAIAGDDVITTELDLAKAYLEMGEKESAKTILQHAINHGNAKQQQQAHELFQQL